MFDSRRAHQVYICMPRQKEKVYQFKTSASIEKKSVKPVIYFIFLFLTIFAVVNIRFSDTQRKTLPFANISDQPQSIAELSLAIRKKLQDTQGTYSVRFEDFESKNAFGINDESQISAGSIMYIPLLVSVYDLADKKELDINQRVTVEQGDIQNKVIYPDFKVKDDKDDNKIAETGD